eukprot:jgi/Tetstr1/437516/TSEL_026194.t1
MTPHELREVAAGYFFLPSPCLAPVVGCQIILPSTEHNPVIVDLYGDALMNLPAPGDAHWRVQHDAIADAFRDHCVHDLGIAVRREVDDLFQQAVPLGNTVPRDELKDLVPDAELSLPAFNVVTGSYDPRSLKSTLLEFKTMRYGVKYTSVPRATAVDRFERSLLGDIQRGLATRDAAWHNTEPGHKGPLRDILDMSEYTGMVFGTVGEVSKGVHRTIILPSTEHNPVIVDLYGDALMNLPAPGDAHWRVQHDAIADAFRDHCVHDLGIAVRREVDDLFQQAVPLGNTVPRDELKDLVPDAELSLPAFNVVTGSYDPRSLKSTLLEFKTMRYGVKYTSVPRATAVDRFERSLLGDIQRGLATRDAAWHNTEPGHKGPLRDILDMSEYTGMVFGTVGEVSKGVHRTAVPLGNTVPRDELKDLVPDAELSLPALNVVTGSYDPRSLKSTLMEFKTMRQGVKYTAVPRATAVDRFERSLLGDIQRGLAARDAAWHNTEPGQKGPLRDMHPGYVGVHGHGLRHSACAL